MMSFFVMTSVLRILYSLQKHHQCTQEAITESTARVQSSCYEGMDQGIATIPCYITPDAINITNMLMNDIPSAIQICACLSRSCKIVYIVIKIPF